MSQIPPTAPQPPAISVRAALQNLFRSAMRKLRSQGARYWIAAILVLIVAKEISPYVYDYLGLTTLRSQFFQGLLDWGPRPAEPRAIKIVRIEDDEYWEGPLAGRRPIKRDYLANLVNKLVSLNVHIIALDFDVRLPKPFSLEIPEDYRPETRVLVEAIKDAARRGKKVILATPVSLVSDNLYRRDTDIYQVYGLCPSDSFIGPPDPATANVDCGFIALPDDPLRIPPPISMATGGQMDPFSLAVARAAEPELVARLIKTKKNLGYLDFITHDMFQTADRIFSARALRLGLIDPRVLDSKVVIVGGAWSRDAAGRGLSVDTHPTAVGDMVGVELHANFAEAFLDRRVFDPVSHYVLDVSEIVFGIFAAIVFALIPHRPGKALGLLGLLAVMFGISALALRLFGVFFRRLRPAGRACSSHTVRELYGRRRDCSNLAFLILIAAILRRC
jgi:CHASE2 domain-containing sensor protein